MVSSIGSAAVHGRIFNRLRRASIWAPQKPYFHPKPYSTATPGVSCPVKFQSFTPLRPLGLRKVSCLSRAAGDIRCLSSSASGLDYFSPASEINLKEAISRQTDSALALASHLMATEAKDKNFVFSPVSIDVVLSLLAAGAKGRTLDEFLSFLKSKNIDELKNRVNKIVVDLLAVGDGDGKLEQKREMPYYEDCAEESLTIKVANGLWVDESLRIKEKFQQVADKIYNAEVKQVDFRTKYEEVPREVNLWAEEKTNGLIKNILQPDSISEMTRLILANAIYFKGSWIEKFDAADTKYHPFHLISGDNVKAPFMTSDMDQYVAQFDGFKVLGLPYRNGYHNKCYRKFSMYIFLPDAKDGLPALAEKLGSGSAFVDNHIPRRKINLRKFLLPKFKISYGFEASEVLKNFGLVSTFMLPNDLTEIADSLYGEELYVSKILHEAFIQVDEEGTEAGAVTIAFLAGSALGPRIKIMDFVADHPFLFVLRENVSGLVLFVGQVLNPLEK